MDVESTQHVNKGKQPVLPSIENSTIRDPNLEAVTKRIRLIREKGWEDNIILMTEMPEIASTSAGGDTDEKRTEGFLHKYRNGELGIVCGCHGLFLTPAEFMQHAGGADVGNPMKHITVFSNKAPF